MGGSPLHTATSISITGRSGVEELLSGGAVLAVITCPKCTAVSGHATVNGTIDVRLRCGNRRCGDTFRRTLPRGRSQLDAWGGPEFPVRCTRCRRDVGQVTVRGQARLDLTCPGCRKDFAWPATPWPRVGESALTGP